MYKALIDTQSISDKEWLKTLDVIGEYDEEWPGEEIPVLHILKAKISDKRVEELVTSLSQKIEGGWFAVVWNEEKILVVFNNKIIKLSYSDLQGSSTWSELIGYGKEQEIDEKYFTNMLDVMKRW